MQSITKKSTSPTMTSLELVKIINEMREDGQAELRHTTFTEKVRKVLGDKAAEFSAPLKTESGQTAQGYILPKREAHLMVMSESYKVQAAVYDKMTELEENTKPPVGSETINMMLVADNLEANIKIAKLFGFDGNQALLSANKATKQVTGIDCMALHGIELIAPSKDKFVTPTELGKELGLSGMKVNLLLAEKGYQVKHSKNWHLTPQGKDLAILQDTNKKHSDGTPVQQIKWCESISKELA